LLLLQIENENGSRQTAGKHSVREMDAYDAYVEFPVRRFAVPYFAANFPCFIE